MENSAQILNPLLSLHLRNEAEMQRYGDLEIVSTFGQPQAEYAAIHKSCGIMDLPFRGVLRLTGPDRHQFLNGLISNRTWDKETRRPMPAGSWVYAFLLNLKGRIVADMNVIELGDETLIDCDARLVKDLKALMEQYLFTERVTIESLLGTMHGIGLYGPQAAQVLQGAAEHAGQFGEGQAAFRLNVGGVGCVAFRDAPTGTDGFQLILPSADAETVWNALLAMSERGDEPGRRRIRPVGWAAFNACRIEAGTALFGIDFGGVPVATASPLQKHRDEADDSAPGILPAETGRLFPRAVDLTKCYIGQEIVARMHARQACARQIAGFRMSDDALPLAGATIHDASGNHIGMVTSSTISPVMGNAAIGLAFVKKPHFAIGATWTVPAEGQLRTATVVELPFLGR
ncbi:MAG: hypothetical protein NZ561_07575 [Phycisphaerae bacterium]|nr:hypothetical protein [Phycisphaerae bacterium]MDW8263162.1 glycine cleavage T C-terminal barrel domain-containing protein [Phycisphaerales bacterium]